MSENHNYARVIGELQAEIERLSNPWVSVEDRLPEDDGLYLTLDAEGEIDCCYFEFDQWHLPYITKWMPIPEIKE